MPAKPRTLNMVLPLIFGKKGILNFAFLRGIDSINSNTKKYPSVKRGIFL